MKQKMDKIGNVLFVIFMIFALMFYAYIGYELLGFLNIGADGS